MASAAAAALLPPFGRPRGLGTASRQVEALEGCLRQFWHGLPWSHLMWERLQLAHATTGTKISSYEGGEVGDGGMEEENGDADRVGEGESLNAMDMDELGMLLESKDGSMD